MTEWDEYYMSKSYGYTPDEELSAGEFERRLCYTMLGIFVIAILLVLVCIELS